jgi:hypothetical protein
LPAMFIQNQDFNALVAELVRYTTFMLQNYGGFLPLGASVSAGEVQISAPAADQQHSTGLAWLEDLREGLRRQTADAHCAAVAYCVDVKLTDTRNGEVSEAVQVVLAKRWTRYSRTKRPQTGISSLSRCCGLGRQSFSHRRAGRL